MSDHGDHGSDDHGHDDHDAGDERVTSPMQEFSMGQVTTGFVVLVAGLVLTFGLGLLLA